MQLSAMYCAKATHLAALILLRTVFVLHLYPSIQLPLTEFMSSAGPTAWQSAALTMPLPPLTSLMVLLVCVMAKSRMLDFFQAVRPTLPKSGLMDNAVLPRVWEGRCEDIGASEPQDNEKSFKLCLTRLPGLLMMRAELRCLRNHAVCLFSIGCDLTAM